MFESLQNLTYSQRWTWHEDETPGEKPADIDEIHEVGNLMNNLWDLWKDSEKAHEKDVETIGAALKEVAEKRQLCEEFEQSVDPIVSKLDLGEVFRKAVDRRKDFKVTLEFNTRQLGRYAAIDAVLNQFRDRYAGTTGLRNYTAVEITGDSTTPVSTLEDLESEDDNSDDYDDDEQY